MLRTKNKSRMLWLAPLLFPTIVVGQELVFDEISKLQKAQTDPTSDARKLAEIYFLTSRCVDIKKYPATDAGKKLSCACLQDCTAAGVDSQVFHLRKQVENPTEQTDLRKEVHSLGKLVTENPMLAYWANKALERSLRGDSKDKKSWALKKEIETYLASFEQE